MILQILIDHEQTGSPDYKNSNEIASAISLENTLVERHLDVLAEEGYVELAKTFEGSAARITPRALVYQDRSVRQRPRTEKGKKAEEDRQRQAIDFFEEACKGLWKEDYTHQRDLETALMKVQHAVRLLNWTKQLEIVTSELMGYPASQELPTWRKVQKTVYYEKISSLQPIPSGLKQHEEPFPLSDSISSIICVVEGNGYEWDEVVQFASENKTWHVKQVMAIQPFKLERLLNQVRQVFFSLSSEAIKHLQFEESVASVFERYRQLVEEKVSQLGIASHLEAVIQDLNRQNPESWRAAALGCRNILSDLAKKLWQAPDSSYLYLNNMPLKGGATDLVKNRLRAWLHQKRLRRSDDPFIEKQLTRLADCVNDLYKLDSKGKQSITYEDALSCVMNTYILLGEMALRTDLQPVTQIQRTEE